MKVRTSYVSNSSSSSFLILYKDLKDFDQLKAVKGYETFIGDLQDPDSKELCVSEIERLLSAAIYEVEDNCPVFKDYYPFSEYDTIEDLMKIAEVPVEKLDKLLGRYRECAKAFVTKLAGHGLLDPVLRAKSAFALEPDDYKKYHELKAEFSKSFQELRWKDRKTKRLADEIYNKLQEKGFEVHRLEYEDHTEDGWYMEKGFMPFAARNPDCQYVIITTNNH